MEEKFALAHHSQHTVNASWWGHHGGWKSLSAAERACRMASHIWANQEAGQARARSENPLQGPFPVAFFCYLYRNPQDLTNSPKQYH